MERVQELFASLRDLQAQVAKATQENEVVAAWLHACTHVSEGASSLSEVEIVVSSPAVILTHVAAGPGCGRSAGEEPGLCGARRYRRGSKGGAGPCAYSVCEQGDHESTEGRRSGR